MATASMAFDDTYPRAHPGWLHQRDGDWAAVRAAVEAEPDWAARPRLRYWMGLARHHLGEPERAIGLWLPLCWMDPALFAQQVLALPSTAVREGWSAFERAIVYEEWLADTTDPAMWFPAWLLARHWGLVHLFRADEIPDAGPAARAFRVLLSLLPLEGQALSDELIAQRRALQRLSPGFFRGYMTLVSRRKPGA